MANALRTARLEAASGGIETDTAPTSTTRGKAVVLQNYLPGELGRTRQRGSITASALNVARSTKRIISSTPGYARALFGFRAGSATNFVEPWVAPYRPSTTAELAQAAAAASDLQVVNFAAATVTGINPTNRARVPGPRWTRFGKYSYAIAYDSNDDTAATCVDNGRGGKERLNSILRWDGTAALTPEIYTYVPYGAQDIRVHYGRLVVLGGRDPSTAGLNIRHNRIWYTRALLANDYDFGFSPSQTWTAGPAYPPLDANNLAWQDEVITPAVSAFIDLPGDEADFGVAMGSAGRHLAIFKRDSIVLMTGFGPIAGEAGPGSWQLRTFADGIGCLDPRSVVDANDGCFFLSKHGYMFYDGVQLIDVSKGLHRTLLTAALKNVGDTFVQGGFAISERLTNDYIMLSIGSVPFTDIEPVVDFCGLFHIPSSSWQTFQSTLFTSTTFLNGASSTSGAPAWLGAVPGYTFGADKDEVYVLNNITTPDNIAENARGKDGSSNIETLWHSRSVELSSPFYKSTLKRVIVDYEWIVDGQVDGVGGAPFNGPTVYISDGHGAVLDSFPLPSMPDQGDELSRRRYTYDTRVEASEIQIQVHYLQASTARALVQNSIHDVWIEYLPGQEP